jgi:hypothetical protein
MLHAKSINQHKLLLASFAFLTNLAKRNTQISSSSDAGIALLQIGNAKTKQKRRGC